jgi:hypothetical protein
MKTERLERDLANLSAQNNQRIVAAELKVEAVRAGIVDLDGLKLLDTSNLAVDEKGAVPGAATAIQTLRSAKPWLFRPASTSNPAAPPSSRPPHSRSAIDMTDAEYTAAREAILRQYR